ncbi:hypothetical protein [Algisphaera agarilytica]|uniref:Tetratricopeptide (TPR) repeat protein n=1 Tax=Algisphaera agarilytica TaxID=1385975 RepID=A0A7X0H5E5_9BACT|nr:hypothetical protein [Algisphaera agarilytica]MBB6429559.1 tetratricopeptide (TPR) repeat protein [Algisphaera agarilytica]
MSQASPKPTLTDALSTDVEPDRVAAPTLTALLRRAAGRWRGAQRRRLVLWAVALMITAGLAALLFDASLGLPAWGLIALDLGLIGLAVALLFTGLRSARASQMNLRRTAVAMERRGGVGSSQLINALDLMDAEALDPATSEPLRELAVTQGDSAAQSLTPGALVDRQALGRAWGVAAIAVVVGVVAWLTMPRVFDAVVPRLLSPTAGLPAYTTLQFEVAVVSGGDDGVIHVGKPGVIEVTLSRAWGGRALPEEADVVIVDHDGQSQALPMHRSYRDGESPVSAIASEAANASVPPAPPTRFSLRFERIDEPFEFYIDTPDGRSQTYTLPLDTTPLFESLHVTVTPPDYTGWGATTLRLHVDEAGSDENHVKALPGSAVMLAVSSNVPLAEAHLELGSSARPQVFPVRDPATSAETLFIVDHTTTAQLQLVGVDGKASAYLPVGIEALEDAPPTVSIHSPEPIAFAVEGYPVPVRVMAKDDVGVASLKLHLSVEDGSVDAVELSGKAETRSATPPYEKRIGTTHELDLAALGAKPGDTVRYFASARDALPFALGGPPNDLGQRTETLVQEIQVISQEEWQEMARLQYGLDQLRAEAQAFMDQMDQLEQARAEIVEQLAELKDKLESGAPMSETEQQQMQELQQQLEDYAEDARALAQEMRERAEQPSVYEFEEPFKEQLKELAEQLEQQAEMADAMQEAVEPLAEAGESRGENGSPSPLGGVTPTQVEEFLEQAQQMMQEEGPFDEETQAQIEELEEDLLRLELAEEMLFHAERIREVIVQQRELEKKLGELRHFERDALTPEQVERLMAYGELEFELREELEDAALMLRESAELAGPMLPNMSGTSVLLVEKLDELEVYPDMERAGERAEASDAPMAHAAAQIAADKLESLLSDAGSMPGQAQQDFGYDPPMSLPKANRNRGLEQMSSAQSRAAQMRMQQGRGVGGSSGGMAQGANASIIGPRPPMDGSPANARSGRDATGEMDPTRASGGYLPEAGEAETLNPESTSSRGRAAIALPGVPARYQDDAAAYFQRLADEAARQEESP